MPIENILKFLRDSVLVQDPEGVVAVDPDFLSMTDEDLIVLLQIALSKVDSEDNLFDMSSINLHPMILCAKKELYHRLAVKSASKYTLTSSSGASLSKSDIFDHYYKLIEEVETEYARYLATGTLVKSSEITLDSRYFTQRNYNLSKKPQVKLSVDNVYDTYVELSWSVPRINKFAKYELYIGDMPIIDKYNGGAIHTSAKKLLTIQDIHTKCTRVTQLKPDTEYYLLISVEERNGLKGHCELKFTTLKGGDN